MYANLKHRLRTARRRGKAVALINVLMTLNQHRKNFVDFTNRRAVTQLLQTRAYGDTPESWVEFAMTAASSFMRPLQDRQEITNLVRLVESRRPKTVLEIGTAKGGSLFLFCRAAADDATIVSIDLPFGRNGGGYPDWKTSIYKLFAKPGQTMHLLRTSSHLEATRDAARKLAPGGFDMIMIDADHSYEGVKIDFELYAPLLAKDGIVVLHDILHNPHDPEIEVARLWDEIKPAYEVQEIVTDYGQGGFGIGVVKGKKRTRAGKPALASA